MVGRIPVMDVAPVVDLGRRPAKATVGEPFPVTRHGVPRGPRPARGRGRAHRPRRHPRGPGADGQGRRRPRPVVGLADPRRSRARSPSRSRPGPTPSAPGSTTPPIKIDAGRRHRADVHRGPPPARAGRQPRSSGRRARGRPGRTVRRERRLAPGRGAAGRPAGTRARRRAAGPPAARAGHRRGPLPGVRRPHPGAVRQLVRVLPPLRGRQRRRRGHDHQRHAAHRRGAPARGRRDGLRRRLPAARSTRSARSTARAPTTPSSPGPTDPGSPWAIGSKDGGHDAIHPDLGTFEDFDAFVARASELGLEVALDLALQAAPDHPWVTSHPEWFTTRADGTIAYAENPPKKYQDIYPVNFDNDPTGICREVLRVVKLWMSHGVRIFRVDNPHTKPVAFWEWLLGEVRRTDPDVLFLAEAFTRPAMMRGLGAVGFHQSYTYFTWRTAKWEIEEYLRELAHETDHLMRPNFFVNTPDILHAFLQYGGPTAFKIRAALAATGSPTWGVYAGYELYEHVAVRPGSRGVPRLREVPGQDPRLGRRRGRGPHPRAVPHDAQRRPPRAPGAAAAARPHRAHQRRRERPGLLQAATPPAATRSSWSSTSTRTAPARPPCTSTCPALGLAEGDSFVVHDEVTGQEWTWSSRQLRPARPRLRTRPRPRGQEGLDERHPAPRSSPTPPTTTTRSPTTRTTRRPPTGSRPRSSTRCWSARSATPTATAPVTSRA